MRMKLLLIGAVVLGVVGLFALQLFGPNSGGTLGPQTTYISAPLAADGLPNYALAILELQRRNVTPENNGARLFWQAMGPQELSAKHYGLLCQELGISRGDPKLHLVPPYDREVRNRVQRWLRERQQDKASRTDQAEADADASLAGAYTDIEMAVEEVINLTLDMPWTREDCLPMAQWVEENEAPLDLLVAAAAKPRFFSPSPDVLEDPTTAAFGAMLPAIQCARNAIRALGVRSLYLMGAKQYAEAWRDLHAGWQLGSHLGDGATIVDKLVGAAIRGVAGAHTLVLLQSDDLPEAVAQQILDDLSALPSAVRMADAIDVAERYIYLDLTLRSLTGRFGPRIDVGDEAIDAWAGVFSCDIDEPLRIGNQWHDQMCDAARIQDFATRRQELDRLDKQLVVARQSATSNLLPSFFSRGRRSEAIGNLYASSMLASVKAAVGVEDRDEMNLTLTRMAAALAVYRLRHGDYPESLEKLMPDILAAVPMDRFGAGPPIYQRRGDGYVLYSVFENGVDDGGRNYAGDIDAGEWLPEDQRQGADQAKSDLVIRMPRPRRAFQAELPIGEAAEPADESEAADVIQSQ